MNGTPIARLLEQIARFAADLDQMEQAVEELKIRPARIARADPAGNQQCPDAGTQ